MWMGSSTMIQPVSLGVYACSMCQRKGSRARRSRRYVSAALLQLLVVTRAPHVPWTPMRSGAVVSRKCSVLVGASHSRQPPALIQLEQGEAPGCVVEAVYPALWSQGAVIVSRPGG